jgi:cytoskeletal protein CcmA (bactofilin family)
MMKFNFLLLSAAALFNGATAAETVDLGTASEYAILTKTGISTVPDSVITGHIGVSPIASTAITGFGLTMHWGKDYSTCTQVTGKAYASDYSSETETRLITAVGDMQTAYGDASGRATSGEIEPVVDANGNVLVKGQTYNELKGGLIGGETLFPGVYTFTTDVSITATIYLDGSNNVNGDNFIIKSTGSLKQAANTQMILTNGATHEQVFWQLAGTVEVEAGAHVEGTLLVKTNAVFKTGSSLNGRVLAQTACTLDHATIDSRAASA